MSKLISQCQDLLYRLIFRDLDDLEAVINDGYRRGVPPVV